MLNKKKDLGIKIVSKEKALWLKVRDARKVSIERYEEAIEVEKVFLEAVERKLASIKD